MGYFSYGPFQRTPAKIVIQLAGFHQLFEAGQANIPGASKIIKSQVCFGVFAGKLLAPIMAFQQV